MAASFSRLEVGATTSALSVLLGALNSRVNDTGEIQLLFALDSRGLDEFTRGITQQTQQFVIPAPLIGNDPCEIKKGIQIYISPHPHMFPVPAGMLTTGNKARPTYVRYIQSPGDDGDLEPGPPDGLPHALVRVRLSQRRAPVYVTIPVRVTAMTAARPALWMESIPLVAPTADWLQPTPRVVAMTDLGEPLEQSLGPETTLREYKVSNTREIRDNVLALMRTGCSTGQIWIGVDDSGRVVGLEDLQSASLDTALEQLAEDLTTFFQGVFPPIPRDAELALQAFPTADGARHPFALCFRYRFPSDSATVHCMMHSGNTLATLTPVTCPGSAQRRPPSTTFKLITLEPLDVWQLARSPSTSIALRCAVNNPIWRVALIGLMDSEATRHLPLPPGLMSTPPFLVTAEADALNISARLQQEDPAGRWLVIACLRTPEEAAFTRCALGNLHLDYKLVVVLQTYALARPKSDALPLLGFLRHLRAARPGIDLIDIVSVTLSSHVLDVSQQDQHIIAAKIQQGVQEGLVTQILPTSTASEGEAMDAARQWVETASPLSYDAFVHAYPSVASSAPAEAVLRCFNCQETGGLTRFRLYKQDRATEHPRLARCTGASSFARAIAFQTLVKRPDAIAVYFDGQHPNRKGQAAWLAQFLADWSKRPAPLVIIADDLLWSVEGEAQAALERTKGAAVVLITIGRLRDERASNVFVAPVLSKAAREELVSKLQALYPDSVPHLKEFQKRMPPDEPVHFLMPVLTALCRRNIVTLQTWIAEVLSTMTREQDACIKSLAFLACFGQELSWVDREAMCHEFADPALADHLLSLGGLVRSRGRRITIFHPLVAQELLGLQDPLFLRPVDDVCPLPDATFAAVKASIFFALKLTLNKQMPHLLKALFTERDPRIVRDFSPLVSFLARRLTTAALRELCEASLVAAVPSSGSQQTEIRAHVLLMCSRFSRKHYAADALSADDQASLALELATEALKHARAAYQIDQVTESDGRLFIFFNNLAWANAAARNFLAAHNLFQSLYDRDPTTITQHAAIALRESPFGKGWTSVSAAKVDPPGETSADLANFLRHPFYLN